MTTAAAVQWRKEFRELLPWWAAIAITMVACRALMEPDLIPVDWLFKWALGFDRDLLFAIGLIAYAAGAVTLGAISIGNEYSHDTLTQLLVQPAARGQVLRVKLVVLALMLAALGALAFAAWGAEPSWAGIAGDFGRLVVITLPLACGLLLAPWFTMLGRGPLSGAVFTAVLPSFLWTAGTYLRLPESLLWTAAAALFIAGATMTWRRFQRLEVAGGSQSDIDVSDWFSRSKDHVRVARTQNPAWQLVKKELRLQQMTLLVTGVYVIAWLLINLGRRLVPHVVPESPLYVIEFLQGGMVPVMLGALACAEERRLGAAEWHTLLPFAAWKQWTIKAGLGVVLAVVLTYVLPELLQTIAVDANRRLDFAPATAIALCIAALYVSSLSSSGLRALLATPPAIGLALAAGMTAMRVISWVSEPAIRSLAHAVQSVLQLNRSDNYSWITKSDVWLAVGLMLLLLRFAYTNHRTSERGARRIGRQFGWIAAYGMVVGHWMMLSMYIRAFSYTK